MTCLFIGGVSDGQRIAVPDSVSTYRAPHGNCYDTYRIQRLASPVQRYQVFVEEHLTLDDAMRMLIDSYQSKQAGEAMVAR